MEIPKDMNQLVALMRRPEYGEALRFVTARERPWRSSLSLKPEEMDAEVARLSALAVKLPRRRLKGVEKRLRRKEDFQGMGTVLRAFARATAQYPEVKGKPERLLELARKLSRYQNIREQTGRAIHGALDLRLVLGALQAHMLRGVLVKVVARLEDPSITRAEEERLRSKFSKLLLHRQALLMTREERAEVLAEKKKEVEAQVAEVEKRTLVADVKEAIRQKRPVDEETLVQAGQYNRELKAKEERKTKR
jgi:hypothetical protein